MATAGVPAMAHAQDPVGLELQQYRPITPSNNRGFGVEGTKPLGHLKLAAGFDFNYASQPLRVRTDLGGVSSMTEAVRAATAADLMLAIGLFRRFELAVALPVALDQAGQAPPGAPGPATSGVGDIRVTLRARLWEQGVDGWSLAASLTGTSPLGQSKLYLNNPGASVEPRLVLARKRRSLQFGLRLGLRLREDGTVLGTKVGSAVTFGAGVDKRLGRSVHGIVELVGSTPAGGAMFKRELSPLESLAGLRYNWRQLSFGAAAGLGIVAGVGSPAWRLLGTVAWSNDPPDADRDGLPDTADSCPDDAEDRDGFEDGDGCPDPDNDKDGVFDAFDQCPMQPEDLDGFEDEDGCPELDNDKDGILDASDKCPDEPETENKFEDEDGCPDEAPTTDKDGDGILDRDDKCPEEAEDKDGFEDEDGCPDPDNDKDGILDADDKCPFEPETINGRQDDDGCPDEGAPQVRIGDKELETLAPVFFTLNRFRVRHRFWNILDQIALTLKAHPEIGRCAVEGHSDATGPDDWNKRLSVMRAETVVAYLTAKGVDAKRLSAIGQGVAKPWADNQTAEGRARNRRVVFHIEGVFSSRLPPSSKKVLDADEQPSSQEKTSDAPAASRANPVVERQNSATPPADAKPAPPAAAAPAATQPAQGAKTLREAVRLPGKP